MKAPTIEDVIIEPDLGGGAGGRLVIRDGGKLLKVTRENSVRMATAQAVALGIFRDEILALKGALLAKKKGGA